MDSDGTNNAKPYGFKWIPLAICLAAALILVKDIIDTSELTGARLAQSGFGIFFDFVFYAVPSIFLVIICMAIYIKSMIKNSTKFIHIVLDPFVVLSVLVVLLTIVIYVIS